MRRFGKRDKSLRAKNSRSVRKVWSVFLLASSSSWSKAFGSSAAAARGASGVSSDSPSM